MSKELEILRKHLGNVEGESEFATKELCLQIDDANDFIAALQVLDRALKKIEYNLKERNNANLEHSYDIDAQNNTIIENASFMGEALFDKTFSTNVGASRFSFEIHNPLLVFENGGYEGVLAYVEDKREEISALLDKLDEAIIMGTISTPNSSLEFKDFKELLR